MFGCGTQAGTNAEAGKGQQAPRSLHTTPSPPLGMENPCFPQRPLVFPCIVPISTPASLLSCHSSFLCSSSECRELRERRLVPCLQPGGLGSSCLRMCCGNLHRRNAAPGLALQAPCREELMSGGLSPQVSKINK